MDTKSQQNSCSNFTKSAKINQLTGLDDDTCYQTEKTKQSMEPGGYMLDNFYSCNCDISNIVNISTENHGMLFTDGYGISECNVDNDSTIRIGRTRKSPKCSQQLFTRPFLTVPYMGRGSGNADIEHQLLISEILYPKGKTSNNYSESEIFTPQIPYLQENIQNTNNLIIDNFGETRGGVPTRQILVELDYLQRSTDSQEVKDFIQDKKKYLRVCE